MALLNQNVQNHGQIKAFFDRIREAQAPEKFTIQFLTDLGFTSSNFRSFIPLLKGLGFLTEDGSPKSEYMSLLDPTQWSRVLGNSICEKYSDIFTMKARPTKADKQAIIGKFKSTYNLTDLVAERSANTFLALLEIADVEHNRNAPIVDSRPIIVPPERIDHHDLSKNKSQIGIAYNIQIQLPATKDLEVYNAIFRSLREHLID